MEINDDVERGWMIKGGGAMMAGGGGMMTGGGGVIARREA